MKQYRDPSTGWWATIPEPKEDSALMGWVYVQSFLAGVFALVTPPQIVQHAMSMELNLLMGAFLIISGCMGMPAARFGKTWLERPAIWMALTGWAMLAFTLVDASLHGPSVRAPQTAATLIILAVFCWRFWRIRPDKKSAHM